MIHRGTHGLIGDDMPSASTTGMLLGVDNLPFQILGSLQKPKAREVSM